MDTPLVSALVTVVPYVVVFVVGVLTHRAGLVDLAIGLLKPTGQTSQLLADVKTALTDVQKAIAEMKASAPAPAAPSNMPSTTK